MSETSVRWRRTDNGAVAHAVPASGPGNRVVGAALCGVLPMGEWHYTRAGGLPVSLGRCLRCREAMQRFQAALG
jgi:hypothetical protein